LRQSSREKKRGGLEFFEKEVTFVGYAAKIAAVQVIWMFLRRKKQEGKAGMVLGRTQKTERTRRARCCSEGEQRREGKRPSLPRTANKENRMGWGAASKGRGP